METDKILAFDYMIPIERLCELKGKNEITTVYYTCFQL